MNRLRLFLGITAFVCLITTWEHVARLEQSNFKPSVAVNYVLRQEEYLFETLGRGLAKCAVVFDLLHRYFRDFTTTLHDLFVPLCLLSVAPIYSSLKGYVVEAATLAWEASGSLWLLTLLGLILLCAALRSGWKPTQFFENQPNKVAKPRLPQKKKDIVPYEEEEEEEESD